MSLHTMPVKISKGKVVKTYDSVHGYSKWGRGVILVLADEKRRVFVDKVNTINPATGVIETKDDRYEPD